MKEPSAFTQYKHTMIDRDKKTTGIEILGTDVDGVWPHGSIIGSVLPGGRLALIVAYHSANMGEEHYPEIFEIPDNPKKGCGQKGRLRRSFTVRNSLFVMLTVMERLIS